MNRLVALLAVLLTVVLSAPLAAEESPPGVEAPRYHVDEKGRSMRVGFSPGSRVIAGVGWAPSGRSGDDGGSDLDGGYIEVGASHRHRVEFAEDQISYKIYHHWLHGRAYLDDTVHLEATAYSVLFSRWSAEGAIVFPSSPPRRIAFPLNIGLSAVAGRAIYREQPLGYDATISVLRADVVLDPWRRRRMRSFAHFGVGPRYDIELQHRNQTEVAHLVAPFTAGCLAFHHETFNGHHTFDASVDGGFRLRVNEAFYAFAEARLSYEAVLVAINDAPVSAIAAFGYAFEQRGNRHGLTGTLGLRASVPVTW